MIRERIILDKYKKTMRERIVFGSFRKLLVNEKEYEEDGYTFLSVVLKRKLSRDVR